ncbi:MAG: DUF3307 domain-containing protein [Candidatus Sabulitectum sp.]|nr:DUF3307 domain-containing protein [Candidatus Sabulitectum sp.]
MKIDIYLLALLAGHFIGDFVLQSDGLVERKRKNPWWIFVHVLIVSSVTWVFLGSFSTWFVILQVAIIHFLIDTVKIKLQSVNSAIDSEAIEEKDPNRAFALILGDQFLHIMSLILIWLIVWHWSSTTVENCWVDYWGLQYTKGLILISGFAVGVWGIAVALRYQMMPLAREIPDDKKKGLLRGGKTIGLLERTLVLIFVLVGNPEGVAFVVAAKSIFRIGDLTDQVDRLHAEYIMIGTLRSFTYAIIVAFLMKWLLTHLV